jgi:carbamoyl-phosphate synthase large subunit
MGGSGGGIAYNQEEFVEICKRGLEASPTKELLIEESLLGWKEFEMEVVRDSKDNCIIVCSIENLDPMGVHTGDSITVAPAQTLTDKEYQIMRNASIAVLREIGVDTGGSNVQFAINPEDGRMIVIEMNPRVSRSSALASKATGFPIAKVAAKLAVGYTLDELKNDITGGATPASFEPSIDYVVTKIPRFAFEKFPQANDRLTTQMKSVGEVMAIGRSFQESMQKALRGLEVGVYGFDEIDAGPRGRSSANWPARPAAHLVRRPRPSAWHDAGRGVRADQDRSLVPGADRGHRPIEAGCALRASKSSIRDDARSEAQGLLRSPPRHLLRRATRPRARRRHALACVRSTSASIPAPPSSRRPRPTCTRPTRTSAKRGRPTARRSWCSAAVRTASARASSSTTAACMRRSRCARTATRPSWSTAIRKPFDRLRHLGPPVLRAGDAGRRAGNRRVEKPVGVIVQFGGQTPLKLARDLEANGVPIIGTSPDMIDAAEDRERFQKLLHELGLKQPPNRTARAEPDAMRSPPRSATRWWCVRLRAGRPRDGNRARAEGSRALHARGVKVSNDSPGAARPLPQRRHRGRRRCLSDGKQVMIGGIMEHIEQAGVHSGDSACSLPPFSLSRKCRTSCAARPKCHGQGPQRRRPDERAVRDPGPGTRCRGLCWK